MHRTRRAARALAWRDEKNPFGKSMYWKHRSDTSRLEQGEAGSDEYLTRITTDDPSHYREAPSSGYSPTDPRSATTAPSALSRRRDHEVGDAIDIPNTASPAGSIREISESPDQGTKSQNEKVKPPTYISRTGTQATDNEDGIKKSGAVKSKWVSISSWNTSGTEKSNKKDDDGKPVHHFTVWSQIHNTIFNSWINILLVASPVGIALHFAKQDDIAIFVVNFIAIIPLAGMLSFATEEIALRVGEVLGGLLNASFGNAVELIVSIIALVKNEILIVQTSLIGSILSNLLLVLGMCFFGGGVNRMEQEFNMTVAQTAASLLFLAVSSLIIPTAFGQWAKDVNTEGSNHPVLENPTPQNPVYGSEQLSLATAVVLLVVYACYLFFQLKSHTTMYSVPSKKNEKRDLSKQKAKFKRITRKVRRRSAAPVGAAPTVAGTAANQSVAASVGSSESEEEREEPQLSLLVAIFTLAASTALVALNAECLVDSIDAITCKGHIPKVFVGLILLPIVGNAAEHATAVTVAIKDKMDLAIGVAVGSSMQIALLILPLMVVLGQIIGKTDMTLFFDGFQIAVLFVTVLLVNYLIQDGKSHWLEGILLMVLYIIIAVAAWYYPPTGDQKCPGE